MNTSARRTTRRVKNSGQTMVLFAISMLLLAVTVLTTLTFAQKIRDKIELQNLADATAFTNATATARAFNDIAISNRAQIAHMVEIMGIQSEISFASMGAASAYAAELGYTSLMAIQYAPSCNTCFCASGICPCPNVPVIQLTAANAQIQAIEAALEAVMQSYDALAGTSALLHQLAAALMFLDESNTMNKVKNSVAGQSYANQILADAKPGLFVANQSELTASPNTTVSKRELNGGLFCKGLGAACDTPFDIGHVTNAAMGSRQYSWVSSRQLFAPLDTVDVNIYDNLVLAPVFLSVLPSIAITYSIPGTSIGSGYLSSLTRMQWPPLPPYSMYARGEDYIQMLSFYQLGVPMPYVNALTCYKPGIAFSEADAFVKGGIPLGVMHQWGSNTANTPLLGLDITGVGFAQTDVNPFTHFLVPCGNVAPTGCPGVWPPFIDYNNFLLNSSADVYGQPKNMTILVRDLHNRTQPDPFDLLFNFKFSSANSGKSYAGGRGHINGGVILDQNGQYLANGTDISSQVAMAHGIAYYHRDAPGGWKEPPSMLNPYWRSTLVASDVDQQGVSGILGGGNDPALTLNAVSPQAAATLNALQANGFKGIQ